MLMLDIGPKAPMDISTNIQFFVVMFLLIAGFFAIRELEAKSRD